METIDEYVVRVLPTLQADAGADREADVEALRRLFAAQVQSRHLDFAARWLQTQGQGHYTIGSAGHESNAALGLLSEVTDPALLHYRSGGLYAARSAKAGRDDGVRAILQSLTSARSDPMSGGRHKVFGHPALSIIPQTSTISSHLPRAVGLGLGLGFARRLGRHTAWPEDAVVLCSFGDASVNHSTAVGALNAAAYLTHRGLECPVLFVCEDNRIGISTASPVGWPGAMLERLPGIGYRAADGDDPVGLLTQTRDALDEVRASRRPGVLHLSTVRFLGHAGSDTEIAYRTRRRIEADHVHDPLVATARVLVDAGAMTGAEALDVYEEMRRTVMQGAEAIIGEARLESRPAVMAPLALPSVASVPGEVAAGPRRTLAQAINATLAELLEEHGETLVFGEDVAVKGGVYGVTRGLRKRFGGQRVFDTLLDEQTILGTALGTALAGFVPIPEIQYLAYLHNAEDQLRGEAASLAFFSAGQYRNGMVVRVAGLAYQRGFGGHFHNDNSVAVLRDIPGLVLAVPSHPADAPGLLRACHELARQGQVCVYLEPIARYHSRDLHAEGDGLWTAAASDGAVIAPGELGVHGEGRDIVLVTFGNGTFMSLRAAEALRAQGIEATVVDLRWLAPLPEERIVDACRGFGAVLVVDETRRSGGVGEGVVSALVAGRHPGRIARVASADSFIPLGPASDQVLLGEDEIVRAALALLA
ncbi:thiamine pyrophosphate-dependent enzyme [Aeromicrobium choanae]|uniref:2-oxoisovalerate dehydrogenase E1 component n=1 Tax=Aeromicrobium choanae TaxID=1736691 RepID=A0A1T4Z6K4_9ACTN|nr:thiamine pyrophosphate-dependent enzyme [Aeromicrobium choanae]SKB09195.1 2-oxoisovalerate dehydrogenase E1 component [Aeromicrobium choanae]